MFSERNHIMAVREKKGLVARWLEGKERSEDYARSTLPTNRWSLFWDIFKGRFGKLVLINLLVLVTFLPMIAIVVFRAMSFMVQGASGPFGAGLGVGYPAIPNITGTAEMMALQSDLVFFGLLIPAGAIAAIGISGGMYIIRNLIWTEGVFVANDFARGIKRNYLSVLEAMLVFTVFLFLAQSMGHFADLFVVTGSDLAGWMTASKIIGFVFVGFSSLICLWMISLGVNYKQGPWSLFRNAVVMTVGTLPQTLFFSALALAPLLLVVLGGGFLTALGVVLLILLSFSFAMLVWMDFSQWAFDRFINPNLGAAVGRGIYSKNGKKGEKNEKSSTGENFTESAAMREYKRMIVAQGRSKLVCRPIKPIDDDMEVYQLPESFSRDDLRRLKESKDAIEEDTRAYEEEHKNEERYVEYNRQFDERERALQSEEDGKKKKPPKPPKMLNKRK